MKTAQEFQRSVCLLENRLREGITAHISTEEELKAAKTKVDIAIKEFQAKISAANLDDESTVSLYHKLEGIRQQMYEFADKKLEEEPVRLLYYKTSGNRVAVKISAGKYSYCYTTGHGRAIRRNKGSDSDMYPRIISVNYVESFLYENRIRDVDTIVDPASVDVFYSFNDQVSAELTPSFVGKWWGYDCPELYRHMTNKERHVNALGFPIPHFSHKLVDSTWLTDYIGDDITEEEIERICKGREETRIYSAMQNMLEARKLRQSKADIEQLRSEVEAFDKKVQEVIDKNKGRIYKYLSEVFADRVIESECDPDNPDELLTLRLNDNFGLDCGFIFIKTTDTTYSRNRQILSQADSTVRSFMDLRLPYSTQSTTLKRVQFDKVRDLAREEIGINLYCQTVLD